MSCNQSCWVKAVADRLSDAHLLLVVWVSHGIQLCNVQIFFLFQVICRIARDLWVQKHAWGKFYHFMEMAIPSIHSSRDLRSTLSRSSCHYHPFVKQPVQQHFGLAMSLLLRHFFISLYHLYQEKCFENKDQKYLSDIVPHPGEDEEKN